MLLIVPLNVDSLSFCPSVVRRIVGEIGWASLTEKSVVQGVRRERRLEFLGGIPEFRDFASEDERFLSLTVLSKVLFVREISAILFTATSLLSVVIEKRKVIRDSDVNLLVEFLNLPRSSRALCLDPALTFSQIKKVELE